jgi:hypothetical protein
VHKTAHCHLWGSILAGDAAHVVGTPGFRQLIHAYKMFQSPRGAWARAEKENTPMTIVMPLRLAETHVDYSLLMRLEEAIYAAVGGRERFAETIPAMLRQAIDEVIDTARSKRFTLGELEKTEKTYLGTKVKILLRNVLDAGRGAHMDLLIDGIEVDVKNTVSGAWTIPNEAIGHVCILISSDEAKSLCSFGLIVIRPEILNRGRNRDGKTTIRKAELANVHWLLKNERYPANFWMGLDPEARRAIVTPRGGTERVAMLFRLCQRMPISRKTVVALAQQDDPMRRIRKNGGARDPLGPEGIVILSGMTQKKTIAELGLPFCRPDQFISYTKA